MDGVRDQETDMIGGSTREEDPKIDKTPAHRSGGPGPDRETDESLTLKDVKVQSNPVEIKQ
jgi:hypothetical protein